MKYISLFSGIGGFEVAIHKIFPEAECLGYSEIKPSAIKVYEHHFPNHRNLGDITQITNEEILELVKDGCDLIVGGFPCTNLSSLAAISGDFSGIEGPKSGLLYEMLRFLKVAQPKYFISENNYSMKKSNKILITKLFREIFQEVQIKNLNAADFGVQNRKRIFWTNFKIKDFPKECTQTWDDVLEPLDKCMVYVISDKMAKCLNKPFNNKSIKRGKIVEKISENLWEFKFVNGHNSKWDKSMISDTMSKQEYKPYPVGKARTIIGMSGGTNNLIIDRRTKYGFLIRQLSPIELERLFNFPDEYTSPVIYKTSRTNLLGNSVVVNVIEYILKSL